MSAASGTTKRKGKLPPVPTYPGKVTKRADKRARILLDREKDVAKLDATSGTLLLLEAVFDDGFEVIAAEVYAVHPGRLIDVHLRGSLPLETNAVKVYRTSLGVMA